MGTHGVLTGYSRVPRGRFTELAEYSAALYPALEERLLLQCTRCLPRLWAL